LIVIFEDVRVIQFIPKILVAIVFMVAISDYDVSAQSVVKEDLPTGKVDKKVLDHKNPHTEKKKKLKYIYVKKGKKLLIGNRCAMEVTRKIGFEYQLHHKNTGSFGEKWNRNWHNTWVKTNLFFSKNPFWRSMVRKNLKKCAKQSGDYRG